MKTYAVYGIYEDNKEVARFDVKASGPKTAIAVAKLEAKKHTQSEFIPLFIFLGWGIKEVWRSDAG